MIYIDHPVWKSYREVAKRGPLFGQRIPRNAGAMRWLLLPSAPPRVVPHRWVVLDRYNPAGVAAAARRDAAARGRRSVRAADGGVVDVAQALHGSPSAPPIIAQRVARFDHNHAHNCLPSLKLHREIQ